MDKSTKHLTEKQLIKFFELTLAGLKSGEIVFNNNLMISDCNFTDPNPYVNYTLEFQTKNSNLREMLNQGLCSSAPKDSE
jgi:hypothetical protein